MKVAEVKRGRWLCVEDGYVTCDKCNQSVYVGGNIRGDKRDIIEYAWRLYLDISKGIFDYCPNCGAKMTIQGEHDEQE